MEQQTAGHGLIGELIVQDEIAIAVLRISLQGGGGTVLAVELDFRFVAG